MSYITISLLKDYAPFGNYLFAEPKSKMGERWANDVLARKARGEVNNPELVAKAKEILSKRRLEEREAQRRGLGDATTALTYVMPSLSPAAPIVATLVHADRVRENPSLRTIAASAASLGATLASPLILATPAAIYLPYAAVAVVAGAVTLDVYHWQK